MEEPAAEPPIPDLTLTERFFERAREAGLSHSVPFSFTPDGLLEIIETHNLQIDFELRFHQLNNAEVKRIILRSMAFTALELEEKQKEIEDKIDLLDRIVVAPTATISAGAIASIIATAGAALPLVGLAGGVIGLALAARARYRMRRQARRFEFDVKRIRAVIENLKDISGRAVSEG